LLRTLRVGSNPDELTVDSHTGDVYVANYYSESVSVLSGTSLVTAVTVGSNPVALPSDS
jgi:DNA-binding beta-propeller fold protein YncE